MRRRARGDRGAAAVEFALVVPIALVVVAAILLFGLHMTYAALADHSARVALKTASLRTSGGYPSESAVRTKVDGLFAADLLGGPTSFTLSRQKTPVAQGDTVSVRVVYRVPAVQAASGLVPDIAPFKGLRASLQRLGSVTRRAEGRAE